ncbi:hypothetical protein ABID42_003018 [Arcicella rosea]|uniref:hypothetical protein n=1 Tax=Arcicella rosea TaxID=502909 RepID=UPI00345CAB8B
MNVTFEVNSQAELEKLFLLFKSFQFVNVKVVSSELKGNTLITKGNKSLNPKDLFGIWKSNPRSLEEIRSEGWKRNWE